MDKKSIYKRVIAAVVIILLTLFMTLTWWLFDSGRLVYSLVPVNSNVACGADVVDKYNNAMFYQLRNGSTKSSIDEKGLKDLIVDIRGRANFKTDPTCQTIIFWSAVQDDDFKVANNAYNEIINLHKKRIFADSNLRSDTPLFMYKDTLNGLTGSGVSNNGTFGG